MAITVTNPDTGGKSASTPTFTHVFNVVMDASYPTGGETLDLQTLIGAGKTILNVTAHGFVTSTGAPDTRDYHYNSTSGKLMARKPDDGAQVSNATDLSTITVKVVVTSY